MSRIFTVLMVLAASATGVAAQTPPEVAQKVMQVQPQRYEAPDCGISSGHFRVRGAAVYLGTATRNETNRSRLLSDALRTLTEAIQENDQSDNPAAWYYMGRAYLYQGDVIGADTALTRAAALNPPCAAHIDSLRRRSWLAIQELALGQMQDGHLAEAIATYRLALRMYTGEAQPYYVMGSIFEADNQLDSATAYYRRAARFPNAPADDRFVPLATRRLASLYAATDQPDSAVVYFTQLRDAALAASDIDARDAAQAGIARAYFEAKRYDEAAAAFRQLERWRPEDENIKRNLAIAFQAGGRADSAQAVMATITGRAAPVVDTNSARFLINRGVEHYRAKEFAAAGRDFTRAAQADPANRLALVNLGYVYAEEKDGPKLVATAQRLLAAEPLFELGQRFLVQGYVLQQDGASARAAADRLDALTATVDSIVAQRTGAGLQLSGVVVGRKAAPPMTLVFEFLDGAGAVVSTVEAPVPALAAGSRHRFTVTGAGSGVVDWRYRRKG